MPMTEVSFGAARPIDGYGPGFWRVGGTIHQGPVLVTATGARPWRGFDDPASLVAMAAEVDVLIVGTGAEMVPVPGAFRAAIEAAGLGVEQMSSPAGARTYNVLLAEGRRVAAALLPV